MFESLAKIIDALGGVVRVANHCGVPVSTVGSWKSRNSVPDVYRPQLIALADEVGIPGLTYEVLTLAHVKRDVEASP